MRPSSASLALVAACLCLWKIQPVFVQQIPTAEFLGELKSGSPVVASTLAGPRIAWIEKRGKKMAVVVDGVAGREYDYVLPPPRISRDGRIAYTARNDKVSVGVVDGQEIPGGSFVRFSNNGDHVGYLSRDGKTVTLMVDHQPTRSFPKPWRDALKHLYQSADLAHVVAVEVGSSKLWLDGSVIFDRLDEAAEGLLEVTDRRRSNDFEVEPEFFLVCGQKPHVGVIERRGRGYRLTLDGVPGERYYLVHSPRCSPDGASVAYVGIKERVIFLGLFNDIGAATVVMNGTPGPDFAWVTPPVFSEDGHWAYVGVNERGAVEVVDGKAVREVPMGDSPKRFAQFATLDSSGKRLAYVIVEATRTAVRPVEGMGAAFRIDQFNEVQSILIERGTAARRVILDGKEVKAYRVRNVDGLQFLNDGRLVFEVHDDAKSLIVVGDREISIGPYDQLMSGSLVIGDDAKVRYIARKGNGYYRVTQSIN